MGQQEDGGRGLIYSDTASELLSKSSVERQISGDTRMPELPRSLDAPKLGRSAWTHGNEPQTRLFWGSLYCKSQF